MNVYITKTRKRVVCFYCHKHIEVDEYQVVCTYFMKPKGSSKTWTKKMHFHAKKPSCWVDRAVVELERRPYHENRGRIADNISDEVKIARQKILRRRASIVQRIGAEMAGMKRMDKLSHLTDLLEKLRVEIEPLGGVPDKWK